MHTSVVLGLSAALALVSANAARAEEKSPIFGKAVFQLTTQSQNKNVVGKGATADYYGYYGNYYSSLASQYGSYGSYAKSSSYYNSAATYAYDAYYYYYYASYYQSRNQ